MRPGQDKGDLPVCHARQSTREPVTAPATLLPYPNIAPFLDNEFVVEWICSIVDDERHEDGLAVESTRQ